MCRKHVACNEIANSYPNGNIHTVKHDTQRLKEVAIILKRMID